MYPLQDRNRPFIDVHDSGRHQLKAVKEGLDFAEGAGYGRGRCDSVDLLCRFGIGRFDRIGRDVGQREVAAASYRLAPQPHYFARILGIGHKVQAGQHEHSDRAVEINEVFSASMSRAFAA